MWVPADFWVLGFQGWLDFQSVPCYLDFLVCLVQSGSGWCWLEEGAFPSPVGVPRQGVSVRQPGLTLCVPGSGREELLGRGQRGLPDGLLLRLGLLCQFGWLVSVSFSKNGSQASGERQASPGLLLAGSPLPPRVVVRHLCACTHSGDTHRHTHI